MTLMASGIIKIINIYHKKREGNKKKKHIYIYGRRRMVFLSQKKEEGTESDVVISNESKLEARHGRPPIVWRRQVT